MKKPQCTPLVAIQWYSINGRWKHVQVPCKRWSCKWCGPIKRSVLRNSTADAMEKYKLNWFLTLTLPNGIVAKEDSPRYIQNCWNKFLISVRRKHGKMKFIVFKEFQKNGMVHLHAVVDKELRMQWTSDAWSSVGGGKIVDVRPVEGDRAASYLCKYVTKEVPMKIPKAYRRVSASRGIVLYPRRGEGVWKAFKMDYRRLAGALFSDRVETLKNIYGEEVGFVSTRPAVPQKNANVQNSPSHKQWVAL